MLCCMAVHPNYRKYGIATKMIDLMLTKLPDNCDVVVTTFREEDEKGIAPQKRQCKWKCKRNKDNIAIKKILCYNNSHKTMEEIK